MARVSDDGLPPEDDRFPTDEEADAWLEEWAEVDREAAAYLREHLRDQDIRVPGPALDEATTRLRGGLKGRDREAAYVRAANGSAGDIPDDHDM